MNRTSLSIAALLALLSSASIGSIGFAQTSPTPTAVKTETTQDLVARLTPQQKQQFDGASKAFGEHRYADSMAMHQELLKAYPGDPILLKFSTEDALENGDPAAAMHILTPLVQADPDDWQTAALLTHACAEAGDKPCRDVQMDHMIALHARGIVPSGLQQYPVERVRIGENTLLINTSLVPWGNYKVYALGKLTDKTGKLRMSITLESSDFDQPGFAKDHPDQAAKGVRRFSIDTYTETGLDSAGKRTQTQGLYEFVDGQPSYETIREKFLKVASGHSAPVASRSNLQVP